MIPEERSTDEFLGTSRRAEEMEETSSSRCFSPFSDFGHGTSGDDYNFPDSPDFKSSKKERAKSYIPSVPQPKIVSEGTRKNTNAVVSKMDPRAWLEVIDPYHRYSKHLRAYHRAWNDLGQPENDFFIWLDRSTYEIEECPKSVLNSDYVYYCNSEEVKRYELRIDINTGLFYSIFDNQIIETGENGWIFVLRDDVIVATEKRTSSPRFHHSSFYAGGCVEVAGILVIRNGQLNRLYPHSGHYRPAEKHVKHILDYLQQHGIDLMTFEVNKREKRERESHRERAIQVKLRCVLFLRERKKK